MEKKIVYFEKTGRENTAACLEVVKQAVKDFNNKHIVVATTWGDTGLLFSEAFRDHGMNLVVVTHSAGFKEPNTFEMPEDVREKITAPEFIQGQSLLIRWKLLCQPSSAGFIQRF